VCLGQQVVVVDESDLEVGEVRVQPAPVELPGSLLFMYSGNVGFASSS